MLFPQPFRPVSLQLFGSVSVPAMGWDCNAAHTNHMDVITFALQGNCNRCTVPKFTGEGLDRIQLGEAWSSRSSCEFDPVSDLKGGK